MRNFYSTIECYVPITNLLYYSFLEEKWTNVNIYSTLGAVADLGGGLPATAPLGGGIFFIFYGPVVPPWFPGEAGRTNSNFKKVVKKFLVGKFVGRFDIRRKKGSFNFYRRPLSMFLNMPLLSGKCKTANKPEGRQQPNIGLYSTQLTLYWSIAAKRLDLKTYKNAA
jgi:hypothetical protein